MKPGRRFHSRVWSRIGGKDFSSTGLTLRCVQNNTTGMTKLAGTIPLTRVEYNYAHDLINHMLYWVDLSKEVITLETR